MPRFVFHRSLRNHMRLHFGWPSAAVEGVADTLSTESSSLVDEIDSACLSSPFFSDFPAV